MKVYHSACVWGGRGVITPRSLIMRGRGASSPQPLWDHEAHPRVRDITSQGFTVQGLLSTSTPYSFKPQLTTSNIEKSYGNRNLVANVNVITIVSQHSKLVIVWKHKKIHMRLKRHINERIQKFLCPVVNS